MPQTTLPIVEMIASAFGGGGVAKLADFIASRGNSKAYTMGAVDHAVQTAMTLVTERLERVEGQHEACEKALTEVKGRLDTSEQDRRELKNEISRLMAGPVANYTNGGGT